MNEKDFDYVIIGGGIIGASILKELTQANLGRVALLDFGRTSLSATAHSAGMVRVFHENTDHLKLALGSLTSLQALNAPVGSLYFFHKDRFKAYAKNFEIMDEAGYPFEILTATQGRERFPDFYWEEDEWAVYEPRATHFNPRIHTERCLDEARSAGAQVFDSFEVKRICEHNFKFKLVGSGDVVSSRKLILAGGARLLPLLNDFGIAIPLERRMLRTFSAKKTQSSRLPHYFSRKTLEFGRLGEEETVIFSQEKGRKLKSKHWREEFTEHSSEDCYAPNRQGIMGSIPGRKNLYLATGWGGTGFKFSQEIGRRMASLVAGENL